LCSCLTIRAWHKKHFGEVVPFSLDERAKQWYTHNVGKVNGEWDELRDSFSLSFFPISRITSLRKEILDFCQDEKETLGAAWARFSQLTHAGQDLSLSVQVLIQHFWLRLIKESSLQLDITAGGSFMHRTMIEGEAPLDCILESTSFTESLPADEPLSHEEVPLVESTSLLLTYPDSSSEPSPEPEIMEEEEIQPPDFPFEFEEDLFKNFGNTSNYPHERRPPVLLNPFDPLDKASLKEIIKGVTSMMSSEWVQEGELSSRAI
jgi:hypothetical protein